MLVTHHADLVRPLAGWEVVLADGRVQKQGRVRSDRRSTATEAVDDELERLEEDTVTPGDGKCDEAQRAEPPATAAPVEGWTSGAVKGKMYRTCVLLHEIPAGTKLNDSACHRYLSSSSYLLWALALVTIIARPVLSFIEQFWLRRAWLFWPLSCSCD